MPQTGKSLVRFALEIIITFPGKAFRNPAALKFMKLVEVFGRRSMPAAYSEYMHFKAGKQIAPITPQLLMGIKPFKKQ